MTATLLCNDVCDLLMSLAVPGANLALRRRWLPTASVSCLRGPVPELTGPCLMKTASLQKALLGEHCSPMTTLGKLQHRPSCLPSARSRLATAQRRAAVGFGVEEPVDPTAHLSVLPPGLDLKGKKPRAHWNAVALAFLGDSVWELYARRRHFAPPRRLSEYSDNVTADVRAEAQGIHYDSLKAGDFLTEEELDILRWGHSAKVTVPKRFSPVGAHTDTYRKSTALECLVAFLYLTNPSRLHQLMAVLRMV